MILRARARALTGCKPHMPCRRDMTSSVWPRSASETCGWRVARKLRRGREEI